MLCARYPYLLDDGHREAEAVAAGFHVASGLPDGAPIRARVAELGRAGLLAPLATGEVRRLAVVRAALSYVDPLDDLALIIQELGGVPLARAGGFDDVLAQARAGDSVLAFALTEPDAGSDVRNIRTRAERDGHGWRLTGTKWFISNAPDADRAVVFARTDDGVACFLVDDPGGTPQAVSGHSIGRFDFDGAPARLVAARGLPLALGTLERCRPTVGLAAWGIARRAVDETVAHVRRREQFGAPLAELAVVRHRVAEMALELECAALPALHACWRRDTAAPGDRTGYESAVGKVAATEAACRILDTAVQLHGGLGVEESSLIQRLWRDVRPLRIYEGATDVLLTLIAARWLDEPAAPERR